MRLAVTGVTAAAVAALLLAAAPGTPGRPRAPRSKLMLSPYHHDPHNAVVAVRTTRPLIALTFDDGPDHRYTPAVLAALRAAHQHATFFVIGTAARREPRLLRAIERAGDEIGNHTLDHRRLPGLRDGEVEHEIAGGERAIAAATGHRPLLLRPPYGYFDGRISALVARRRLRLVGWALPLERYLRGHSPTAAATAVARAVAPGDIVLLHDGGGRRARTLTALRALLPVLRARGLRSVTVSRLLRE